MKPIIKVENLGKKYTIRHEHSERYTALRDVMAQKAKKLFSFPSELRTQAPVVTNFEDFWALKGLDFEIQQGDRVGIIGRNGAGKSTLLKILSRITEPTTGRITLNGRVASLLEVGTGFHPELTGRENIYLNGAILGMSRVEIRRKFDEIVDFSGVEKFLDTPVKRYSSGMYVRLAFAVAAHLEPEILVVDEVLAVGDAEFQKKCLGKMEDVSKNEGRTVLFVSHSMAAISHLCKKGVMLSKGELFKFGEINEVIDLYAESFSGSSFYKKSNTNNKIKEVVIEESWIEQDGKVLTSIKSNSKVNVILKVTCIHEIQFSVELIIKDSNLREILFIAPGIWNNSEHLLNPGESTLNVSFTLPIMAAGKYFIDLIIAETGIRRIECIQSGLYFMIDSTFISESGWNFDQSHNVGSILLPGNSQKI